eukprot:scaffold85796_cov15-Prasinocladus_malaysianus.AAC.1
MIDFGRIVQSRYVELAPRHLSSGRHVMYDLDPNVKKQSPSLREFRSATWLDNFDANSEQFQR